MSEVGLNFNQVFAYPVIDGVRVFNNIDFTVDGDEAKAKYIVTGENVQDISEVMANRLVNLSAKIGLDYESFTVFGEAVPEVIELNISIDEYTYITIRFTKY